jgi:two-component system alkaline phosphatase synthesis response regulator PhoP
MECALEFPDVLLVEDESEALQALTTRIRQEGYAVSGAGDGRSALSLLRHGGSPSLVITDLIMPGMDGWELCREIQKDEALRHVPIAVLTGIAVETWRDLPARANDAGYLDKPVRVDALLDLIASYCGSPVAAFAR